MPGGRDFRRASFVGVVGWWGAVCGGSDECDAVVSEGDEPALVEVADGSLECFLADAEDIADDVGIALVAVGATALMVVEVGHEAVGEVFGHLSACGLQGDVEFPVATNLGDVASQTVAGVDGLEDLTVVDKAGIGVVDDDFEAEVGLLPYEE